jgi:hypothetical protein
VAVAAQVGVEVVDGEEQDVERGRRREEGGE